MKFRKKPVVIEAWEIPPNDENTREVPPIWLIHAVSAGSVRFVSAGGCEINTREGVMRGDVGDWVIQGVKGELYPCKPDIFAATYDPAE
jgi:hypothetical protein